MTRSRTNQSCEPSVSVVLPTLNEATTIEACLESLAAQTYRGIAEILVIDGGSTDGTRDRIARAEGLVRLLDNPRSTAAAAMNIGLAHARGDVIVRADAHTFYDSDYVRRCVDVLEETQAHNVGGRMRPVASTPFGKAVAAVTSSPLGIGPGKFHYSEQREDVDTVYLGCWRRTTLEELGGFDETTVQWAEDDELNLRLTMAGGRIVLDPSIRCTYIPRERPRALSRQYFNYGVGKVSVLRKHRRLPSWRPLVPAALVASSLIAAIALTGTLRVAIPLVYVAFMALAAFRIAAKSSVDPVSTGAALMIIHWSYGLGFLAGLVRLVRGQPIDKLGRGDP